MSGIALKSCKLVMKLDNGLTETGRQSTKSVTIKGANQTASALDCVEVLNAIGGLSDNEILTYSRTDENLVSDEL